MVGAGLGGGKPAPAVWQHPFVDLFKTFAPQERRGDVGEELDRQICKQVLVIRGAVSANNYARLPAAKSNTKTLGLTGEHIYVQIKALDMKFFLIHLDFTVAASQALRFTLSNMYTDFKSTHHTVQCPCHLPSNQWAVVCVHVPSVLELFTKMPAHAFALKTVQFCASIHVRNVFTSDIRFTPESMPREMQLDNGSFWARHAWIEIPGSVQPGCPMNRKSLVAPETDEQIKMESNDNKCIGGVLEETNSLPEVGLAKTTHRDDCNFASSVRVATQSTREFNITPLPDPFLEVSRLIGVSRKNRKVSGLSEDIPQRFAVFIRSGGGKALQHFDVQRSIPTLPDLTSNVLHASSMALIAVDPCTRAQQCYFGHSRPIELLEASDDALWVASVQGAEGGAPPLVRVWHVGPCGGLQCLSVLSCPSLSSVRVASFDALSKYLALAGTDLQGRQHLMVWDMSRLLSGGNISLCAKQTSADWDIDCVKFSPFEELHLVTCGRESIRFWRAKDGHLPGCSVVLNSLARQSHFTCIAFEFNKMGQPYFLGEHLGDRHRMFVGTSKGRLLQLSYKDRKVQVVHQLHNAAITSICASEGFVVTASADKYVRVWPLDFNSYIMHAMHDSAVVGVDVTVDGLQVLCSTADGSIGMLDMQSHNYIDLVRTHSAMISDAAVSLLYQEIVTASRDGTLKVWSLSTMAQTYEFTIADDVPLTVAFHPSGRHLIAVGFRSGCMRVFDVDGPNMICEYRHHVQPILSLAFIKDISRGASQNTHVLTCDTTGSLVFYDEARHFEVVRCPERILCTPPPENCPAMVCIPPWLLQYFDAHCIGVFSLSCLALEHKIRIPNSTICTFSMSVDARLVIIGASDSRIHLFEVASGNHFTTYACNSGHFSAVALTSFNLVGSFQGLALMLVAASDSQLRISQIHVDEVKRQATVASRDPQNGNSSAALTSIPYNHLDEQCFIGHATPPHKFLMTPNFLVTVSQSEVICWANTSNYFEQLFVDSVLGDGRATIELEKTEMPPASAQHVSSEIDEPESCAIASAEAPVAEQKYNGMESIDKAVVMPDASDVEDDVLLQCERNDTQSPQQHGIAFVADPLTETPEQIIGDDVLQPQLKVLERRAVNMKLVGISGCSLSGSAQSFSWQSHTGILCHSLGGSVHVEKQALRLGGTSSGRALITGVPGSTVLGLDLCPNDQCRLAVLSAGTYESTDGAWLSLWTLEDLKMLAVGRVTDDYFRSFDAGQEQSHGHVSWPVLRAADGGSKVVTAISIDGITGCVDVWIQHDGVFTIFSSAQIHFAPNALLLLTTSGEEFLSLSTSHVMFWRCLVDGAGSVANLEFQLAETHGLHNHHFTAFCLVHLGSWNMLLVGTAEGRMLAYNADDNQFLTELVLSTEGGISDMGCASWPWLVCSIKNTLRLFKLDRSPEGFLQASISGAALQFDGDIRAVCMHSLASEGIISTSENTLWYFNMHEGQTVGLESFHSAPSRLMRSNAAFLEEAGKLTAAPGSTQEEDVAMPEVITTLADDGCLCIWSVGASSHAPLQAVAQLRCNDTCGAISFLSERVLACAMFSGFVCMYSLSNLAFMANIEISAGDPLLALETISSTSLVVGSASGQLIHLAIKQTVHHDAMAIIGAHKTQMPSPTLSGLNCCPAVIGIVPDKEVRPSRLLVLYAGLEAWLWECQGGSSPHHVRTWPWPGSSPKPPVAESCNSHSDCLDLLSSPPLVACFAHESDAESLVVLCAPPAACFYVYSCEKGDIVNRIIVGQLISPVVQLWAPPLPSRQALAASSMPASSHEGASLLVFGRECFASLGLYNGGREALWGESQQLPGSCAGLRPRRSTPSACCIKSEEGEDTFRVVLKGEAALSTWSMAF